MGFVWPIKVVNSARCPIKATLKAGLSTDSHEVAFEEIAPKCQLGLNFLEMCNSLSGFAAKGSRRLGPAASNSCLGWLSVLAPHQRERRAILLVRKFSLVGANERPSEIASAVRSMIRADVSADD